MKKSLSFVAASLMIVGCLALFGCSSGNASSSSSSSASESSESLSVEAEADMLVLGEETDTALNIVFTNKTGSDITNFAVQTAGSVDQPQFLMESSEKVADKEKVSVFTEPAGESLFDAVVVCGDKQYTLHDLNFATLDEATIRVEEDVAYIETTVDGNAVSSLREEYDRAHPPVVEEQAAEPETAEPEAVVTEEAYEEPVYYEEPAAAPAEEAPAQSEDACVSDVVLR